MFGAVMNHHCISRFWFAILLAFPSVTFPQGNIGINIDNPVFDLDIRGTNDLSVRGELQLLTPSQTNFLRFFQP